MTQITPFLEAQMNSHVNRRLDMKRQLPRLETRDLVTAYPWWHKLVHDFQESEHRFINAYLTHHNCSLIDTELVFDSEEHRTMFMLRYNVHS